MVSENAKFKTALMHILSIFGFLVVPLVFYIFSKGENEFVESHSKSTIEFQLNLLVVFGVATIIILLLPIALFTLPVINAVFCIIGAFKAFKGEEYSHPKFIEFFDFS